MKVEMKDTSTLFYLERALNYIQLKGKKSEQIFANSTWRYLQTNQALTPGQISHIAFVQDKIKTRSK